MTLKELQQQLGELEQKWQVDMANGGLRNEELRVKYLGKKGGVFNDWAGKIREVEAAEKGAAGQLINQIKKKLEAELEGREEVDEIKTVGKAGRAGVKKTALGSGLGAEVELDWPADDRPRGHLHPINQAIDEISDIFARIGFQRVRHPEVDSDYFAFEALNMPPSHPARDEWETFFIEKSLGGGVEAGEELLRDEKKEGRGGEEGRGGDNVERKVGDKKIVGENAGKNISDEGVVGKNGDQKVIGKNAERNIVLTPHTSNGQVREMLRLGSKPPIRMINIARCYRRQQDATHNAFFHQFEGLVIDEGISIADLRGVLDYFAEVFYGPGTKSRIRPFHFKFTEPSFEVDFSCHLCGGKGKIKDEKTGEEVKCRFCKSGWHEVGGAGMVHPNVLKAGGFDPEKVSGFAFGWGIERTYSLRPDIGIDDIRQFVANDLDFLEQF